MNYHFIAIKFCCKARAILISHLIFSVFYQIISLIIHSIYEALLMRRITDALEELNTLLSLKFLKLTILLDKILFVNREFYTFQSVHDRLLSLSVALSRC